MDRYKKKIKYKAYDSQQESWFYRTFIKHTVNDNFFTSKEVVEKAENKELIERVSNETKIKEC